MTPTAAPAKPMQFKVKKFTGELPSVNGKERIPSPFDEDVKRSFETGDTLMVECPNDEDVRTKVVAQLHKAAKFVGCGLDLWRSLDDGIAFKARAKREVNRSAPTDNGARTAAS